MGKKGERGSAEFGKILFGRYQIGRLLGMGTFGKVYYALDLRFGERAAIKVLNKDQLAPDRSLTEQITREITAMRLVRHPNVVELREVMATKSRIFFVMEYVGGGDLYDRIASHGRLSEDIARRYFHQLISAVEHCHSLGVSHRNLKLDNLLIDEKGNLKVSDFDLSALPEQRREDGHLHTVVGSAAYVAPEILRRRGYDGAKTDLWSCGVILFALLTGYLPFQDDNLMRMYRKVLKAEYSIPPWVSVTARRLISRLLDANPDTRISIAAIKELAWFKIESRRPIWKPNFSPPPLPALLSESEEEEEENEQLRTPRFYNAFEFISSMSGFNLSRLLESQRNTGTAFTSRSTAPAILDRLEELGNGLGLTVERSNNKYKVKMQKEEEGWKGRLAVAAEVFEVAPEVALVEFSKSSGDTMEYTKFCKEVRPGLKDIVWTWQGDGDGDY